MNDSRIRLTGVKIRNFKNVKYGKLSFLNTRKPYKASILGLYGQNGSGKTALIDALELLEYVLGGSAVPSSFADFIHVDSDQADLSYEFEVTLPGKTFMVQYQFSICAVNVPSDIGAALQRKVRVFDEVLKCPGTDKVIMNRLIDTSGSETFIPASKRILLTGRSKDVYASLIVARRLAEETSRSFIFSREFLDLLRKKSGDQDEMSEERNYYGMIIERLSYYGKHELFVINTGNSGLIRLNTLPLSFRYEYDDKLAQGTIPLMLDSPSLIPQGAKSLVARMIKSMNIVLQEIIPHLTVSIKTLGTEMMENGEIGVRIQLMSEKNEKAIPLKYESDGIKKIISVLQLLIVVYNNPAITVVIDELDAGIFEYLLGELLRIISEKGKGQLIFTSHNLRPLETLDKGFVAFTTTNPGNRYTRMTNVKENNNLRDFYYRDIILGEQREELYELTNNAEIAFAFMEAGLNDAA